MQLVQLTDRWATSALQLLVRGSPAVNSHSHDLYKLQHVCAINMEELERL